MRSFKLFVLFWIFMSKDDIEYVKPGFRG